MTVVSTKEFISNQEKYFDLAESEEVFIQRGSRMFHILYKPAERQFAEQPILEPDNNLRRAITAEELLDNIHTDIRNKFASRI